MIKVYASNGSEVRASLWRIDLEGILMRTMQVNLVQRRHYSVPGPLSLTKIARLDLI